METAATTRRRTRARRTNKVFKHGSALVATVSQPQTTTMTPITPLSELQSHPATDPTEQAISHRFQSSGAPRRPWSCSSTRRHRFDGPPPAHRSPLHGSIGAPITCNKGGIPFVNLQQNVLRTMLQSFPKCTFFACSYR